MTVTINGNGPISGTTTLEATQLTNSGNLTFTGTGNRITGDFSNSAAANRVMFQTTTVNGNTSVGAIPNGTAQNSSLNVFAASDPANASRLQIKADQGIAVTLNADYTGTGTYLPITFETGGSERMRIGTDGTISGATFNAINNGPLAGFRNRIINGDMCVAQRGTVTPSLGSITSYTLDRWGSYQTGAARPIAQVAGNSSYAYALSFSGAGGNTEVTFFQCIESSSTYDLANTGFTLSLWIFSDVAKSISLFFDTPTTTKDVFSATTQLPSGTLTFAHPGTGWAQTTLSYSAANALSNAAAIQRGLRIRIYFGACTANNFGFTGVQLEAGPVATPFEQRPYGVELSLCQRYYYRVKPGLNNPLTVASFAPSTTTGRAM